MDTEINYKILKILESNSHLSQRQMAKEMGISLGKFNYCLRELIKKGVVKIDRFKSSDNKAAYMYILTPKGLEQKALITASFLRRKMEEYKKIQEEIETLKQEVNHNYKLY